MYPPFTFESLDRGHGREETRVYKVYAVEATRVEMPHARTLVVREKVVKSTSGKPRKTAAKKTPAEVPAHEVESEDPISFFLSSRLPGSAEPFAQLIRGHWGGCEIRNHWVRDELWEEDQTRSRNWNLNASLAILRSALIAVRSRQADTRSWPVIFEQCAHSTVTAASLINGKPFK